MKLLQEIIIPQESVNDDKVIVLALFFKNGDKVDKGDIALEFETSKASIPLEISQNGYIFYNCEEGEEVNNGSVIAKVYDENKKIENKKIISKNKIDENITDTSSKDTSSKVIFSKKAEILIKENNLNKNDFKGKDFINDVDINSLLHRKNEVILTKAETTKLKQQGLNTSKQNVSIENISSQKKREIEYLSVVQSYGLNSTVSVNVEIEKVRNFVNNNLTILKGSFLPLIIFELSRLLKKYPKLNSYFENDSIFYYNEVNIGIAIDMDKGLKVIKISNTDKLSIIQTERAILDISRKYIEDKTTIQDVSDVTFTITDLSNSGLTSFLPLINKNNSAILAISSIDEKLKRLNLNITFDHRVTEGKYTASFLNELKTRIESYFQENVLEDKNEMEIRCYKCNRKLKDNLNDNVTFFKVIDSCFKDKILCSICYENY